MKTASTALKNSILGAEALYAKPRVIAEWNLNRYFTTTTIDNFGHAEDTYAYDAEVFPIESIVEPNRPHAGLLKLRTTDGSLVNGYQNIPRQHQVYTASQDAPYKYWTSPDKSASVISGGSYPLSNCQPYAIYESTLNVNKVYVCFENTQAAPAHFTIEVTPDGTNWTLIATDPTVSADGSVSLWLQSDNSWGSTPYYTNVTQINGVRVTVTAMNKANSYLDLIEISPRLENDLTDYLVDYSLTYELADESQVVPIGVASSNVGSVTLSNYDGRFNNDNSSSLYYGIIDSNVKFTLDLGIDTSDFGGAGFEYTRIATMYSEQWSMSLENVQVPLKDGSKFLQEDNPEALLMESVSFGSAIWRICDNVGFNNYAYDADSNSSAHTIDYYWTDSTRTAWDNIQDICTTTQNAVYFDEYGVLRAVTRDYVFSGSKPTTWTFNYSDVNANIKSDIVTLEQDGQFQANTVTVHYKPITLAVDSRGNPSQEIVWQPEGDVVVRASRLMNNIPANCTSLNILPSDAATWPYEGLLNIGGEIKRYKGKEYSYYDSSTGKLTKTTLNSADDKKNIDQNKTLSDKIWQSSFTGKLFITENGVGDTGTAAHVSYLSGWNYNKSAIITNTNSPIHNWGGLKFNPSTGTVRLQNYSKSTYGNVAWSYRHPPTFSDYTPARWGVRMRFPSSGSMSDRIAGIFFNANTNLKDMYYVEVTTSALTDKTNRRSALNEIRLMKSRDGSMVSICGKGVTAAIADDVWFDLDVTRYRDTFSISLNGTVVLTVTDTSNPFATINTGCGIYVRNRTVAEYEYWYDARGGAIPEVADDQSSFLDLIRGGYYSSIGQFNLVYGRNVFTKRWPLRLGNPNSPGMTFDEFGSVVHEIREYDIQFSKVPVVYSDTYISNEYQAIVTEYIPTPWGAKFIVANTSRYNAVINGEDTLTFGADNSVSQQFMVSGRVVQQADEKTYKVTNAAAVRARGEITVDISSNWIQSEAAAKALGDWITDHWSEPSDEISLEVFSNPLVQVGDIVALNYQPLDIAAATHRYFVLSVENSWDSGPKTSLKLRRVRF